MLSKLRTWVVVSFNSTQERLIGEGPKQRVTRETEFQLHSGAIDRGLFKRRNRRRKGFQLHSGAIDSQARGIPHVGEDLFQLHSGAIDRGSRRVLARFTNVVSSPLRSD